MNLIKLVMSIILVSVGTWLILMPFYYWIEENFMNAPLISIAIGVAILFICVKYFKLRV